MGLLGAALCVTVAGTTVALPAERFTLAWQHTVERVRWEEDYRIVGERLFLASARVAGSGAGMEPPPGSVRDGDGWRYQPADPWRRTVTLARSEFGADYELCIDGRCRPLGQWAPGPLAPTTLAACAEHAPR